MEKLLELYDAYNTFEMNDEMFQIIIESMTEIQQLDDMIVKKYQNYHEGVSNRLDFYDFIYNHDVFSKVLEESADNPYINSLIYKIIYVELFKLAMISVFKCKDPSSNHQMIIFALEYAQKDNHIYPIVLELLEDNRKLLNLKKL